jgi:hypothetical protein
MPAGVKTPVLTVPGALKAARKLGASATIGGIPETMPYLQRFAGLCGRDG